MKKNKKAKTHKYFTTNAAEICAFFTKARENVSNTRCENIENIIGKKHKNIGNRQRDCAKIPMDG